MYIIEGDNHCLGVAVSHGFVGAIGFEQDVLRPLSLYLAGGKSLEGRLPIEKEAGTY